MHPRRLLLECFDAALRAVDGRACVRDSLVSRPPPAGEWHVVAVGKAAGPMALGAVDALGERIAGGLIVVPRGRRAEGQYVGRWKVLESSHPVPDESSIAAGGELSRFLAGLPCDSQVLFLVSGGASSLVEVPAPGVTLDDLRACNRWALASGRPIVEINAQRRQLSALKGGGVARLLGRRRALALMISDVPGDDPTVIGSGLLHARKQIAPEVPRVPVRIVANLRQASLAAAAAGKARGYATLVAPRRFAGDARRLGERFARSLAKGPADTLRVWGGESTVRLPANPGRGGRNQHLALAAAGWLDRAGASDTWLLAGGTDGIDGSSEDAGAIVDGGTCRRAGDGGAPRNVLASLAAADSGSFLAACGNLLHTGATSTNVGDMVLGVRLGGLES